MNILTKIHNTFVRIAHPFIKSLDPRLKLLKSLPKETVGAELGVWRGDFSSRILEVASPRELHLIDPWRFQSKFPERRYGGKMVNGQEEMDTIYRSVKKRFQTNRNVRIHRNFSATALKEFDDHYFDWIYIDANHFYDYILKDLEMSFEKVKTNGLITGDDYTWGRKKGYPVRRAVQDFTEERKIKENTEIINSQFIIRLS
jgi:hypothetical protein